MANLPKPGPMQRGGKVSYRVIKKCFAGGVLHEPGAVVEAEDGIKSAALERVGGAPAPSIDVSLPPVSPTSGNAQT